jgi:CRP-like cAMP-binding protein
VAQRRPCATARSRQDGALSYAHCMETPLRAQWAAMPTPHATTQNHLLAALPHAEYDRLMSGLELVRMPLGEVLSESGGRMQYAYFPTTCIVSLLYVLEDGASAEIGVVGNEGVVGISLFMGGDTTPSRAVVRSAGHAYRLRAARLQEEFYRAGPAMRLLLRYTQSLMTQMTQTAVCNRHHSVEQQLCRALLLSVDRMEGDSLTMTQELIARILGVRREGVTEAAGNLATAAAISTCWTAPASRRRCASATAS